MYQINFSDYISTFEISIVCAGAPAGIVMTKSVPY